LVAITELEIELERLILEKNQVLIRYFCKEGHTPERAHELTQDSFLAAHKALPKFRGEAKLFTFVQQIAKNLSINEIRARNTQKRDAVEVSLNHALELAETEKGLEPVERQVFEKEQRAWLEGQIAKLPEKMGQCITLFHLKDFKISEIEILMRLKANTIKSHLTQGRERLKAMIGGEK